MPRQILTITLEEAVQRIDKAFEFIEQQIFEIPKEPIAVAVVGIDGSLVAFKAMDGVMPVSIQLSQDKAYTAIIGRKNTGNWKSNDVLNFNNPRFTAFAGGVLIKDSATNEIIGAIGVSGRSSKEDEEIAEYGACPF